MEFQRPSNVPEYADLCLKAISDADLSAKISLGGAFGLLHYLDYRATYVARRAIFETSMLCVVQGWQR